MLLIFILLSVVPVGLSSCFRRWEWSFSNPAPGATSPPVSPSCLINQSDSILLLNSGTQIMHFFRVNATSFDSCESNDLIGQIINPNSSHPLSLSNQESEVRIISQSNHGSCLRIHFSVTNQTADSCSTPECHSTGPCFRHLSLPFSDSQSNDACSLAPNDWIVLENTEMKETNFSIIFEGRSCYSNFSIKIGSNETVTIPLPHIPQSGVLFSDAVQNCSHLQPIISPLISCAPLLCHTMLSSPNALGPLAISLMSLFLMSAGISVLLALCLRRRKKICTEECPAPPGELPGHFEMKQDGKMVKEPEVKIRKKNASVSRPEAETVPSGDPVATSKPSIVLEKRSSQFSDLLSKFN